MALGLLLLGGNILGQEDAAVVEQLAEGTTLGVRQLGQLADLRPLRAVVQEGREGGHVLNSLGF